MSFSFPKADAKSLGYVPEQVNAFIDNARGQFLEPESEQLSSSLVRGANFDLVKGGYLIGPVDSALDRLEDTFSTREIQRQLATDGDYALADRLAKLQDLLRGRVERPKGKKFAATGLLLRGYNRKQVDLFCQSAARHLDSQTPLDLTAVRRTIFTASRNGYVESQVDGFIDRLVEVLQIEKNR